MKIQLDNLPQPTIAAVLREIPEKQLAQLGNLMKVTPSKDHDLAEVISLCPDLNLNVDLGIGIYSPDEDAFQSRGLVPSLWAEQQEDRDRALWLGSAEVSEDVPVNLLTLEDYSRIGKCRDKRDA